MFEKFDIFEAAVCSEASISAVGATVASPSFQEVLRERLFHQREFVIAQRSESTENAKKKKCLEFRAMSAAQTTA